MENFNRQRFCNYAKWDLTINNGFYRNLTLVIFFTLLGITACSFLMRWGTYSMTNYIETLSGLGTTGSILFSTLAFELLVTSGCVLHPLRNKQGRITNLTLPATSLEKYLWHICACVVGAVIIGVISIAVCDAFNALMTIGVLGTDAVNSLFAATFNPMNWAGYNILVFINNSEADSIYFEGLFHAIALGFYAMAILQSGIYTFGNAVKYKYNIPITYVILQFIGIALFIIFMVTTITLGESDSERFCNLAENVIESLSTIAYVVDALFIVLAIALYVMAYKRYTKAQLISPFNK